MLASRNKCSMGYGERLVQFSISAGSRPRESILRVKTRDLQFSLQIQLDYRRLANVEEIVVLDEIGQNPWVDQQRRFAAQRIRRVQFGQFDAKLLQQAGCGALFTDAKTHAARAVHALGKGAQVQADHRPFQPAMRRRDDFIGRDDLFLRGRQLYPNHSIRSFESPCRCHKRFPPH